MKFVVYILLVSVLCANMAWAQEKPGLLVTPTRVVLEGKKRSASISLVNNGNVAGSYKIAIVNRRMKEDGSIVPVEDGADILDGEHFADQMLRVSPRRVTLGPGERQSVRILAKKPKGLEDGEYRSHLNFAVLPEEELSEREKKNKENSIDEESLTISIRANFGVTIPIIIRNGDISASANIDNVQFKTDDNGDKYISFVIHRQGEESLYGDIEVVYTNNNGKKYIIKSLGGLAVYTPNDKRSFNIRLDIPDGVDVSKGVVEVSYKQKEKEGGKILASSKLAL